MLQIWLSSNCGSSSSPSQDSGTSPLLKPIPQQASSSSCPCSHTETTSWQSQHLSTRREHKHGTRAWAGITAALSCFSLIPNNNKGFFPWERSRRGCWAPQQPQLLWDSQHIPCFPSPSSCSVPEPEELPCSRIPQIPPTTGICSVGAQSCGGCRHSQPQPQSSHFPPGLISTEINKSQPRALGFPAAAGGTARVTEPQTQWPWVALGWPTDPSADTASP